MHVYECASDKWRKQTAIHISPFAQQLAVAGFFEKT